MLSTVFVQNTHTKLQQQKINNRADRIKEVLPLNWCLTDTLSFIAAFKWSITVSTEIHKRQKCLHLLGTQNSTLIHLFSKCLYLLVNDNQLYHTAEACKYYTHKDKKLPLKSLFFLFLISQPLWPPPRVLCHQHPLVCVYNHYIVFSTKTNTAELFSSCTFYRFVFSQATPPCFSFKGDRSEVNYTKRTVSWVFLPHTRSSLWGSYLLFSDNQGASP